MLQSFRQARAGVQRRSARLSSFCKLCQRGQPVRHHHHTRRCQRLSGYLSRPSNFSKGHWRKITSRTYATAIDVQTLQPRPAIAPHSTTTLEEDDGVDSNASSATSQGAAKPKIELDYINRLLANPLLHDPLRTPRLPIVLCHGKLPLCLGLAPLSFTRTCQGLYGFDTLGPASLPRFRLHYWGSVLEILRGKVGAKVIVAAVPGYV